MEKLEEQLKTLAPQLSMRESEALWTRIGPRLAPRGKRAVTKARRGRAVVSGLVILGLLGGSVMTAYASESLPGDTLYPTKIGIEKVRIALAPTQARKEELRLAFADMRVKEVDRMLEDIEEDESTIDVPAPVALMAVDVTSATGPAAEPQEDVPQTPPMLAMKMVAPTEHDDEKGKTHEEDATPTPNVESAPVAAFAMRSLGSEATSSGDGQPASEIRQTKKWKNIEKKRKAIQEALKELQRTKKELEASDRKKEGEKMDAVIVNLERLNADGTTEDAEFIDRLRGGEFRVIEEVDAPKSEGSVDAGASHDSDPAAQERHGSSMRMLRGGGPAAAIVAADDDVATSTIEEVKALNLQRRDRRGSSDSVRSGRNDESQDSRSTVCRTDADGGREIEVRSDDLQHYLSEGYVFGPCGSRPDGGDGKIEE